MNNNSTYEYDYLEIYENMLSKELCDQIIELFLNEKKVYEGHTAGGVKKENKKYN